MIKKPTLFVLLCAIIFGAAVYYFEFRSGKTQKAATDNTKPAFSVQASDIVSFTIAHPAQSGDMPVRFEKRGGIWEIVQPVQTEADQPTAGGIVDALSTARISQSEPGSPDRLKAYGLDPAQVSIEFQLQNGAKHTLLVGNANFGGDAVYTVIDGAKDVSLLPQFLSTGASKPLAELRDRAVLHMDNASVISFSLKNSAGDVAASKAKDEWQFARPAGSLADKDAVDSLLAAVANARMFSVASETSDNLAKYGLASPSITFSATDDKGAKSTLLVGKKSLTGYLARDPSRSAIFGIDDDLYKKLSVGFSDLRDKQVLHVDAASIRRVELQNESGTSAFSRNKDNPDEWDFELPADQKGKSAAASKILDPVSALRADEVMDHAPSNVVAQLAKPAIRVVLTDNDGKALELRISKPSGDFAYAQVGGSGPVYKVKKEIADTLNIKAADLGS